MAEKDIKYTNNLDLDGNKLKNAKVVDAPVAADDIVNKAYFDANSTNELTTTRNTDHSAGNIPIGTDLDGLTALEIIEDIFFSVIPPVYTLPEVELVISDDSLVPLPTVYLEVGQTITNYQMEILVTLNDSDGLDGATPYTYTRPSGSTTNGATTYLITEQIVEGINTFEIDVNLLGATVKNDNTGNPNIIGQFGANTYNTNVKLQGIWAYYTYFGLTSTEPLYTTEDDIKALDKTVLPFPESISYTIPKNTETTIIVAVPREHEIYMALEGVDIGATVQMVSILHQQIEGVDVGDIVVSEPFQRIYTILQDAEAAGDTEVYSVAVYRTTKAFTRDIELTITIKETTGSPIEESTYFDTYYSDEYYTD